MLNHDEAQELHGRIGAALENFKHMPAGYSAAAAQAELAPILDRALELAALLVSDTMEGGRTTDPQPITVYFAGDECGPDRYGMVYDTEDEAFDMAHENQLEVWRVNVVPDWEHSTHLLPDTRGDDDDGPATDADLIGPMFGLDHE